VLKCLLNSHRDANVTPEKGDINKFVQEMPNYEDPNIREGNSEDYKKKKNQIHIKIRYQNLNLTIRQNKLRDRFLLQ